MNACSEKLLERLNKEFEETLIKSKGKFKTFKDIKDPLFF
jgi:hypothetical protein